MGFPVDDKINISREEIYDVLYLDYFFERTKKAFPTVLTEIEQYQVFIRLLAWALARSYQQPLILRYLYNPELVMEDLLPRLADTLSFTYPLEYPTSWLRLLLRYLQKIRRSRGTWKSVKQLLRLLESSEEDILSLDFNDYAAVTVEELSPGRVVIAYGNIKDFEFANSMLRMVMPAGYDWRLENGSAFKKDGVIYKNRWDFGKAVDTFFQESADPKLFDIVRYSEAALLEKIDNVRG